ncbi:hypothetical protein DSL72_003944 [Monilinia vaccinii-corymbosi]|uniref:Uncharacterized protein n=1 Tax=Monilinia vaccinii-corymbosi TaxID=61207 RepID=A0A8A3NZ82_9HELO|nr:hypothetical protein DSL72_003944 [Monilinia vaccinii-corymbosi]
MSAFPPHKSIPSIPVNQAIALKYLQEYLSLTSSTPYLLPNAKLEPTGPTIGSSHSSVTIHNLQRVEAGLRGELLAPTLEIEEENAVEITQGMDDGTVKGSGGDKMDVGGWQDKEEFEREQSIEGGDVGAKVENVKSRQVDSDLEAEPSAKDVPDFTQTPIEEPPKKDKVARKAEKKARRKADLRAKEMKKMSTA